jgi:hypothetical protein
MPGWWNKVKKVAEDAAAEVKDDLSGMQRGVQSNYEYSSLISELSNPKGATLAEQKTYALTQCRTRIPKLTNTLAVEFHTALMQSVPLRYIRQERGFFGLFGAYGHTATYKEIMGLLKEQMNKNYKRHSQAGNRDFADDLHEERAITDIMTARRGRLPNLLPEFTGQAGEYIKEHESRRLPGRTP